MCTYTDTGTCNYTVYAPHGTLWTLDRNSNLSIGVLTRMVSHACSPGPPRSRELEFREFWNTPRHLQLCSSALPPDLCHRRSRLEEGFSHALASGKRERAPRAKQKRVRCTLLKPLCECCAAPPPSTDIKNMSGVQHSCDFISFHVISPLAWAGLDQWARAAAPLGRRGEHGRGGGSVEQDAQHHRRCMETQMEAINHYPEKRGHAHPEIHTDGHLAHTVLTETPPDATIRRATLPDSAPYRQHHVGHRT